MFDAGRRFAAFLGMALAALAVLAAGAAPAAAQGLFDQPKYASIVVDANTGEVLYGLRADAQRFPASISKVMTLYLTFEALTTGRLSLDDRVPFSAHAASQAPSKLGVPVGDSLSVRQAILGLTVKSANDAAMALAERVGGSQERFAQLMTLRAQELGMRNTRYVNPNGLPDARQVSSARDIAILARAVMRDYPQYYAFFNAGSMEWEGHFVNNPHSFLRTIPGVDGLKTGYTNAAGHNLVASAVRDGRRLIVVVLGGTSNATRDENVEDLFDAGFAVLRHRAMGGEPMTLASLLHQPDDMTGPQVRPPLEMGSAEEPGLSVVVRDPIDGLLAANRPYPAHGAQMQTMQPIVSREDDDAPPACVRVHGRHGRVRMRCNVSEAAPPQQVAAADRPDAHPAARPAVASDDCSGLHGRKARACRRRHPADAPQVARAETASDCVPAHGRRHHAKACAKAAEDTPQVAKAQLRECGRHGRRHAKACDDTVAAAADTPSASSGGAYMIQVGAFPSRSAAQAHLAHLSGKVDGHAKVETGSKGYRARFAGLSATEARAACSRLSRKGEACMVVPPNA